MPLSVLALRLFIILHENQRFFPEITFDTSLFVLMLVTFTYKRLA